MNKSLKIWVLNGGSSKEREISLSSGKGIFNALKKLNYNVQLFDVREGQDVLKLKWSEVDLVFPALHGGFGENGSLQGFLRSIQIPFICSGVFSSSVAMDKNATKKLLNSEEIPMPHSTLVLEGESHHSIQEKLKILKEKSGTDDFFMKPNADGSSVGSERINSLDHLKVHQFLEKFGNMIIEENISGDECTCTVMHQKALPVTRIQPKNGGFYNYQAKYTAGATDYECPAKISAEAYKNIQLYSEKVFKLLGCSDYARCDFLVRKNIAYFLEINTLPGMTPTSLVPKAAEAAGMNYEEFIDHIVQEKIKNYES